EQLLQRGRIRWREEERLLRIGSVQEAVIDGGAYGSTQQLCGFCDAEQLSGGSRIDDRTSGLLHQLSDANERHAKDVWHWSNIAGAVLMLYHAPCPIFGQDSGAADCD